MPFGLGFFAAAGVGGVASAYDHIATALPDGTTSVITFDLSGLAATYRHLQLRAVASNLTDAGNINYTLNNTTGPYSYQAISNNSFMAQNQSNVPFGVMSDGNNSVYSDTFILHVVDFPDVFIASKNRSGQGLRQGSFITPSLYSGARHNTDVPTSLILTSSFNNFKSGSVFALYGLKAA